MSAIRHRFRRAGVRGLPVRLRAAWAHQDLDRRLAEGADPDGDPLLACRARRLRDPGYRATLASGLERLVAAVDEPAPPLSARVPVRRRAVRDARHELMRLAGELRHMLDPDPQGVAMAERLLTDLASPVYSTASSADVVRAARDAANAMRPRQSADDHRAKPHERLDRLGVRNRRSAPETVAHRFCIPTVAALPLRVPPETHDW